MNSARQAPCRAIIALLLTVSALGCGPTPPSAAPSAPSVEPTVTTSLEPSASTSTATLSLSPQASSFTTGPWGPLAVVPPQDGADTARNEGMLRITDTCVTLERLGEVTLLYWPADRTTWNEESRTITFRNFDGTIVTVEDGVDVVVGGSGDSEEERGLTGEKWVDSIDWVAPPAPSCPLVSRWAVGAVGR